MAGIVKSCYSVRICKPMCACLFLAFCTAALLRAQSAPPTPNYGAGSAVQQAAPPEPTEALPRPVQTEVKPTVVASGPESQLGVDKGEKLLVREILLPEDDVAIHAALLHIVTPYLNQTLTMGEINQIVYRVTRYYRSSGYTVAKAYLPKQDASDGVVEIRVALGSYGNITIKNRSRLRDSVVKGEFQYLKNNSPAVTAQGLERAILLVREAPGGAMPGVTLAPGQTQGTTDLRVELKREGLRYDGYLLGDDQGSRFTGRKRLFGELDVNAPLGLGDRLSVSGMVTESERLHNVRVAYALPLSYSGLRLTLAATRSIYSLGGSYSVLGATGSVNSYEGTFSYPAVRRHDSNLDLSLNIAHRSLHDTMSTVSVYNPRTADVGAASVQRTKFGTLLGHKFYTVTAATFTVGLLNQEDASEAEETGTNGDYAKVVVNLSAETPLYRGLSARLLAVGQKDLRMKILDSSEQLFISSSNGVRGFAETISGDNGYIFNLELPYALPKIRHTFGLRQTLSAFADSGGVQAQKDNSSLTDYVVNDVGAGYTATRSPFYFKVQGVRILGSQHSETDKTRMWLQMGFVF
jgi:hemolysin activation/secretion protein